MINHNPDSFGTLLHELSPTARSHYRDLEKLKRKLIQNTYTGWFNYVCLNEKLLPNYSNIRVNNPAVRNERITLNFRHQLVDHQFKQSKDDGIVLKQQINDKLQELINLNIDPQLNERIVTKLDEIIVNCENVTKSRITRKLNNLYHGKILLPEQTDGFINLSDHQLSSDQIEFLNLGLNCHTQPKFDQLKKTTEMEILYGSLCKLADQNIIEIHSDLQDLLRAESTKCRNYKKSNLLSPKLIKAAKELRENDNILTMLLGFDKDKRLAECTKSFLEKVMRKRS